MKNQDYDNHIKIVPGFHFFLVPLCFTVLGASFVFAIFSFLGDGPIFIPLLVTLLAFIVTIAVFFLRRFVCKLQDRVIRAEENMRSFLLTGRKLSSQLTMSQITALRFASDSEFPLLCEKAEQENLKPDDIKKAIHEWKADHNRV